MTRVWSTPIFVIAIVYFIIDGVVFYVTRPMRRTIVFGFIAGTCIVAPAFAQTPYDGLWNVTILTRVGSCEPSARYPLTVTDGKVSGAADVSGSIGREGIVKVSIRGAYANGRLNGNGGSGKWNGASGGIACSGRWEASRQ